MSGGGSSKPKQHAADYHMSVHYGVCIQADSVNKVWINEVLTEAAGSSVNATVEINQPELYGGREKQGGAVGSVDYMLGGADQPANAELAKRLKVAVNRIPGFRGITSLFFRNGNGREGFLWSTNMPSLPAVKVEVTRMPPGPNGVRRMIGNNANPAHMIWDCLTNTDWGMGSPLGLIDATSFDACADTLGAEGFGLSMLWVRSSTIEAFVGEILDHIQATLTTDPATGKMKLKLLRADYSTNDLFIVHPGNASINKMQRKVWGETVNDVAVTWTNPENEEEETVNAQDNGNIAIQGAVVSTTRNYYGVRDANLAIQLAYRDLRQSGAPLLALEIEINRSAWDKIVGDVVEVRWPEYGIGSVIMRVGAVNYGKSSDSKILINLMEDIFGLGTAVFVPIPVPKPGDPAPTYPPAPPGIDIPPYIPPYIPVPQEPIDPNPPVPPTPLTNLYMDSVPYFMLAITEGDVEAQQIRYPETYSLNLVNQPDTVTSVVQVWTNIASLTGTPELVQVGRVPNGGRGTLDAALTTTQTVIPRPTNWTGSQIVSNQLALLVNGEADTALQELVIIKEVTDAGIVVIRGILDTNAYAWPAGTPLWIIPITQTNIDTTVRYDGEVAAYKFAPTTNSGTYPVNQAPFKSHTMTERLYQPYRPVALKMDTLPDADGNYLAGSVLSWNRRNRLTETAQVLSQTDQDVTPEVGQTTTLVFGGTRVVTGITGRTYTLTALDAAMANAGLLTIQAFAARDGYLSRVSADMTIKSVATGYGTNYGNRYGE